MIENTEHYVVGYPKERTAVIVMSNSPQSFKIVDDIMVSAIGGSYPSFDWIKMLEGRQ